MPSDAYRPTQATIDAAAIAHNVRAIRELVAPAEVMAVVKANGYGHGAATVATAAALGGASRFAVALVEEAMQLRAAGLMQPTLLLSEPPLHAADAVVAARVTPTVYTAAGIAAFAAAAQRAGHPQPFPVHLKVDTGMRRVGCQPEVALALAEAIGAEASLEIEGVYTHFANADAPDDSFTAQQLAVFANVLTDLERHGIRPPLVHAANSAAAFRYPDSRFDLVRIGIAMYGIAPDPSLGAVLSLRPALSLRSRVSFVKECEPGTAISYGLRYRLEHAARIATVPIGYADGVPRRLFAVGGEVLIRGVRRPIAGTVTMDQLMVDCGELPVEPGDEVVLIGTQGAHAITAWDWAANLDTIPYEIVCGVGARVPREVVTN